MTGIDRRKAGGEQAIKGLRPLQTEHDPVIAIGSDFVRGYGTKPAWINRNFSPAFPINIPRCT